MVTRGEKKLLKLIQHVEKKYPHEPDQTYVFFGVLLGFSPEHIKRCCHSIVHHTFQPGDLPLTTKLKEEIWTVVFYYLTDCIKDAMWWRQHSEEDYKEPWETTFFRLSPTEPILPLPVGVRILALDTDPGRFPHLTIEAEEDGLKFFKTLGGISYATNYTVNEVIWLSHTHQFDVINRHGKIEVMWNDVSAEFTKGEVIPKIDRPFAELWVDGKVVKTGR